MTEPPAYSDIDWLALHHRAKSGGRVTLLSALDITVGDRVLDVGCGPGYFTHNIASIISPGGYVLGIDNAPTLIESARSYMRSSPLTNWEFNMIDYTSQNPLGDQNVFFDVIIFFNTLEYYSSTIAENVVLHFSRYLSNNGRIIIKDNDMSHFYTSLVDISIKNRIIEAAVEHGRASFDNFFAAKFINREFFGGLPIQRAMIVPYVMRSPFTMEEAEYISSNMMVLANMAQPGLDQIAFEKWRTLFTTQHLTEHVSSGEIFVFYDFIIFLRKSVA